MEIKFKRVIDGAKLPYKANPGDAGYDLSVASIEMRNDGMQVCYHTGIAVEIPEGHVGLLYMRSSAVYKTCRMANATGVIDSGYRGEITAVFDILGHGDLYQTGDRCCQLVVVPYLQFDFVESDTLSDSERGNKGYGSSGVK
jgi:dUTP pyrophosphatase